MGESHDSLEHVSIECPYCGERLEIAVIALREVQEYVEDCSVCCRPIELRITGDDDGLVVDVRREDD
jgi:hypothetical protein